MSDNNSGGIGFIGLLTIVFVVLKLTNYVTWSWWWVISPVWLSTSLVLTILLIVFIVKVSQAVNKEKKRKETRIKKGSFRERLEEKMKENN